MSKLAPVTIYGCRVVVKMSVGYRRSLSYILNKVLGFILLYLLLLGLVGLSYHAGDLKKRNRMISGIVSYEGNLHAIQTNF